MKNILILFFIILFTSCTGHKPKENKDSLKLPEKYEYVHLIPDSLRNQEQQKLCDLILKTVVLNMKVENNLLIFDLPEEDFLNLGIPKPYYDLLIQDVKNVNKYIDSAKIQRVDTILKDSYKELYLRFKNENNNNQE